MVSSIQRFAGKLPICRWAASLAAASVAIVLGAPGIGAQNATTAEVKAAFVYTFARFTEWPEDAFPSPTAPLVVGIAGDERLRLMLDSVARGKMAAGRPLKTRRVNDVNDVADVHVLYVAGTASTGHAADLLKAVSNRPVLTVGDVDGFCQKGGMINVLVHDDRVRFEIRYDTTEHSRLKVSSRVLTLAKTIHGKNGL